MEELTPEMDAALEEHNPTTDTTSSLKDNLAKMQSISANLQSQRRHLGIALKKAAIRHSNAKVDVLVRRFAHDMKQLKEQYDTIVGKDEWAKRLIHNMEAAIALRKNTADTGELVHKPFAALGALLK